MLSEYEERALLEVRERKDQQIARSPRKIVPARAKEASKSAAAKVRQAPGVSKIADTAADGYAGAVKGIGKFVTKSGSATLSPDRVVAAYRKRGLPVESLDDIRGLDLQAVERRGIPRRLDMRYASSAALVGATAGAVVSGGEALAMFGSVVGVGAGAAPGMGTIATAMAGDAIFVLGSASRAVSHMAMCYGYDPSDPAEAVYVLSVINLGSAMTAGGKYAAYQELSKLTQLLARRASWKQLNEHILPRLAQAFAVRFGGRLTQRKLGQLVPVAGIVVGAGLNYKMLDDVVEAAQWTYRERFVLDKSQRAGASYIPPSPAAGDESGEAETEIGVLQLLKDEGVDLESTEQ